MRVKLGALALILGGTGLVSCTTIGGNINGSFSCVAPDGICAPSSTIDDRALAMIAGEDGDRMITPAGPYSAPQSAGRGFDTAAATPARSQERVLRIVFAAQIDGAGRLHEQTAVHAVVERGEWQRALASNAVATTPAQVQAATGGDTLLAAVDRADPPVMMEDSSVADPDMPSAAAVAAARVQADPVGDIKDQVARRLSKTPRRLSVSPSALRTPTALTYGSKQAPTTNTPIAVGMTTDAKPLPLPAPVRPVVTSTSAVLTPKYVTPAGRTAIAVVGANPAVRAGLARAEPEAREAVKTANPLPVLRASSFPGVVQ